VIVGYIDEEGYAYVDENNKLKPIKRRIFNESEDIILENSEIIVDKGYIGPSIFISKTVKDKMTGTSMVFERGDTGRLYRTNKRLIGVRSPSAYSKIRYGGSPFAYIDAIEARDMKKKGAKEFFELSLVEIREIKKGIYGRRAFCIQLKGIEYHLWFSPKKNKLLRNLLEERLS
jgi:hypothetical protein